MTERNFEINIKTIQSEISNINITDQLFLDNYNSERTTGNRVETFFAQPKNDNYPFISSKKKQTEDGTEEVFSLIWTTFPENKPPEGASSQTAKRNDPELPSAIQYVVTESNGQREFEITEVLYVIPQGYSRYIFENNILHSMWNFFDKGIEKIYEIDEPLYITFYPNGKKKEVWYFNPNAESFKEAAATVKMTDDKPVVITYYEDGEINELDYTGYVFSKKIHPKVNTFPFGSRFSFFEPSYIKYKRDSFGQSMGVIKKYFYQQIEKDKDNIHSALEGFGVDISSPETISQALEENPMFDDLIRNMLGVMVLKESELDMFNQL